jgi:hypothetical protein
VDGGGVRRYNIRIGARSYVTLRDLDLRGATLMPFECLGDGVSVENTFVSESDFTERRNITVSSAQRWHGAWFPGLYSDPTRAIDGFASMIGSSPAIVNVYIPWASPWGTETWNNWLMDSIVSRGAIPMVSWEPQDWGSTDLADPRFSLDAILAGRYDSYIQSWAKAAASWKKPVLLRFAHEMNGDWYPWAVGDGRNGNTPAKYVGVWSRIRGIFSAAGASNVRFVWCPDGGANLGLLASLYPGDADVEYVAFDQYNWGGSVWQSAYAALWPAYVAITGLTQKPLFIAEMGSAEDGGSKADFIAKLFGYTIPVLLPRIHGICWFSESKQRDWRVETSSSSLTSYNQAVQSASWSLKSVIP